MYSKPEKCWFQKYIIYFLSPSQIFEEIKEKYINQELHKG